MFEYQVPKKFWDAIMRMWTTLKRQDVWGQCFYMFISFALSLNIHEALFKWETDSKAGPSFSQVPLSLSPQMDIASNVPRPCFFFINK